MNFARRLPSIGLCLSTFLSAALSFEAPVNPSTRTATPTPEPSVALAQPSVLDGTLLDADATPEISTSVLQDAMKKASTLVLDARPYDEFAKSHIPGARAVQGLPGLSPSKYTADANAVKKLAPSLATPIIVYCNGMHCGRSKRFGAELRKLGYHNVRRYQLGIPAWRALVGATQVEKDALLSLLASDASAVLVDAREKVDATPRLTRARWIPPSEAAKAKEDGRLPMTDHNTRIFVVGDSEAQARAAAEAIVRDAFHNVSFYAGGVTELTRLQEPTKR